jgi:peptidoglycan/LPS O-acetylase OafA/YrhL
MALAAHTEGVTARAASSATRFPCFDGLRAIAALSVFMTHLSLAGGANLFNFLGVFWARMDAGVAIFFLLSGFLLYRPFVRDRLSDRPQPPTRPYLWRRVLRIYPAYWLAVIFVVYVFQQTEIPNLAAWLETFALVHIYDSNHYFGPLVQSWTLATEVAFYVFVPIYAWVMRRTGDGTLASKVRTELVGLGVLALVALSWMLLVLYGELGATGQLRTWLPWWIDLFGAGMGLALVNVLVTEHGWRVPARLDHPAAPAISWVLALISFWIVSTRLGLPIGAIAYSKHGEIGQHYLYLLTAFFLLLPAVFGPQDQGLIRRFLRLRPIVYLGVISYGIYLWHEMWIEEYLGWFDVSFFTTYQGNAPIDVTGNNIISPNWLFMIAVVFACTLASASASWYVLEQPLLRLKSLPDRWRSRRPGESMREVVAEATPPPEVEGPAEDPHGAVLAASDAGPASMDDAPADDAPPARRTPAPPPDPGDRRRFWIGIGLIAVAALGVRVGAALTVMDNEQLCGDPGYYHHQANLLADGYGFANPYQGAGGFESQEVCPTTDDPDDPSAVHPPLYTLLLSISSVVGGTSVFAHKLITAFAGVGTVVAIGVLARQFAGLRAGLVAAGIAAIYPNLWVIDGIPMPEDLFALMIALSLIGAVRLWRQPSWWVAIGTGAAIGAAALTRGEALALLPLLVLPIGLRLPGLGWGRRVATVAVVGAASVVVIAPWTIRNLTTFERPSLLSTNEGDVLAQANCDETYYGHAIGFWYFNCGIVDFDGDESVASAARRDKALEYIRDHQSRVPVVVAARVGRVWEVFRPFQNADLAIIEGRPNSVARAGLFSYWVLFPLSIAGLIVLRRRRVTPLWVLIVPYVLVTITVILTYSNVRFRAAAEVAIVAGAAIALDAALRWVLARRTRTPSTPEPTGAVA